MQHGVLMRDLVADWKKWSGAERVLAVMGTLLMVALPLGLLMTGKTAQSAGTFTTRPQDSATLGSIGSEGALWSRSPGDN